MPTSWPWPSTRARTSGAFGSTRTRSSSPTWTSERGCLVLWGDVGTPQPGDRARLYDLLLRYGFHWDETGGVRMAVEGQDGPVIQLVDVPLAGLDGQKLQALVRGFVAKLHAWRDDPARRCRGRWGQHRTGRGRTAPS